MNATWPAARRSAVCLSFDVDADYAWTRDAQLFENHLGGRLLMALGLRRVLSPSLVTESQGEFGVRVGLPRILQILERHGIPATFFVPGAVAERYPEAVRAIVDRGHEVGHHGYMHESPLYFHGHARRERECLERGTAALERVTGRRPVGYRAPGFDLTPQTVRLLEAMGFAYDSTLMSAEHPHRVTLDGKETSLIEVPVDWCLDDFPHFAFWKPPIYASGMALPADVLDIWRREMDGHHAGGGCFTLTLHPSIIGRHHRVWILEELIRHARSLEGVWFARCMDVARHSSAALGGRPGGMAGDGGRD